jgi:hypothetical protein
MNTSNQIQSLFGGLVALAVVSLLIVLAFQGDQTSKLFLYGMSAAGGVAFAIFKVLKGMQETNRADS